MADSSPTVSFCGLQIFAHRDGDRVAGRVEFPYECNGRRQCPIDYHSRRPDQNHPPAADQNRDSNGAVFDSRAQRRLQLVKQWRDLCNLQPNTATTVLAKQIADANGISARSLQSWARKLDIEGPDGLRDHYIKPPKKILTIDAKHAQDAVLACAWWAFRIGNVAIIDTKMMHVAASQLIEPGFLVADVLATIDCYYSCPCDRGRYPFKPFARWARYDFPVPWLYRACDENDYRRGLEAGRQERAPLVAPKTTMSSTVADARMRKREALHKPTRRAIHDLSPVVSEPVRTVCESASKAVQAAGFLKAVGLDGAATRCVQAAAPGTRALAANTEPETIAQALGTLPDGYRRMLHNAARGDGDAVNQALATMPLWWNSLPSAVRSNIDFKVNAWHSEHPRTTARAIASRKLQMLLPALRGDRTGAQRLFPTRRIAL